MIILRKIIDLKPIIENALGIANLKDPKNSYILNEVKFDKDNCKLTVDLLLIEGSKEPH